MPEILTQAGCYVAIIILGYVLRKIKLLPEETFKVLSRIVINITLPSAIISSTSGRSIDVSMLTISALGMGCGLLYILLAAILHSGQSREKKAFACLNTPGYNIGNFAMPFTQGFLGPVGVLTCSLFDVGNSFICLGGAYGVASAVKEGKGFSVLKVLKAPLKSVPFVVYVLMAVLNLCSLSLPEPVISLAQIGGSANPFLGMLMIGAGFRLSGDKSQIGDIAKILGLRFGLAAVLAAVFYYLLPFEVEIRRALVVLAFSPIGSAVPAFTAQLKGDTGLSSAINSISIIISIVCIVTSLMVML